MDMMGTTAATFRKRDGINWISLTAFAVFHAGAVAALFFFSWPAFFTALGLYWISLSLGIGMGYHRLLTHRSYRTPKWIECFLAVCGTLALQGGPIAWVATHRIHHQFSDKPGDPHTPRDGKWWAHILWMLVGDATNSHTVECSRYAPDLCKDRFLVWLSKYNYVAAGDSGGPAVCFRRLAVSAVGSVFPRYHGIACHLDGELLDAFLGPATVCHPRRFAEQLVRGPVELRRGLAQQSPCLSDLGPPWSCMV